MNWLCWIAFTEMFFEQRPCCESENRRGDVASVRHEDLRAADSSHVADSCDWNHQWNINWMFPVDEAEVVSADAPADWMTMMMMMIMFCLWMKSVVKQFVFHFSTDWSWTPLTAMFDVFTWSSPWLIDLLFTLVYLSDISRFKDHFVPYLVRNIAQKEQITVF